MTSLIQPPADNRGPTLLAPVRIWCRVGGDPRTEDGPFRLAEMIRLDRRGRLPAGLEARTRWGRWMPWTDLRRALAARAPRGRGRLASMLAGLVLALLPGTAPGQRVVGTAASRPAPEPAERILARRGFVVPTAPGAARSTTTDTNLALAAAYRAAAREITDGFGRFGVVNGIPEWRRGRERIAFPVRRVAGTVDVLGPEKPEFWVEVPPVRVLRVMERGLLVDVQGTSVILADGPGWETTRRGAMVGGWYRMTADRESLASSASASEEGREAAVMTYGETVVGAEAEEAIARVMDRRKADSEILTQEADRLEGIARTRREEAVARFRAEREAKAAAAGAPAVSAGIDGARPAE